MVKNTLPDFQEFLHSRKLVPVKNIAFYAHWVSCFLTFVNNHQELSFALRLKQFLDQMSSSKNIADWQLSQANEAVSLYVEHFLRNDAAGHYSDLPENREKEGKHFELSQILSKMHQAIRLRHYSYRTERTYLDWVKKFYNYLTEVKKKTADNNSLNSTDVRDYLTYLAIKQRVSSSTQNLSKIL